MATAYIGTSGFFYSHWRDVFYPKGLPQKDWFEYYCRHFKTVELNVSFYRLPKKETFAGWRKKAGKDFVFSVKGSRYITHIKRLKDCQEPLERFFEAAKAIRTKNAKRPGLAKRSGAGKTQDVILWQLPPRMAFDKLRLKKFLAILPQDWRHAFEFRHETWLDKEIYKFLKKNKAAIVFQDFPDWPRTVDYTEIIGLRGLEKLPFIYYRFHGAKALYTSGYSDKELKEIAVEIRRWLSKGKDVYAYFNNDALGYAVENALALRALIS